MGVISASWTRQGCGDCLETDMAITDDRAKLSPQGHRCRRTWIRRVLLGRSVSSEVPNQHRVVITADRPWVG